MSDDLGRWDSRYAVQTASAVLPEPAEVVRDYAHLLPKTGRALDLACGLGGNALFLARRGLVVSAWDISSVAIDQVNTAAQTNGLRIDTQIRDLSVTPPPAQGFDVICVSRYLDLDLFPAIIDALRPNGLLFYQTFIADKDPAVGPANPAYLLAPNELLQLSLRLQILVYREEGRVGDLQQGFRNEALLVAQVV